MREVNCARCGVLYPSYRTQAEARELMDVCRECDYQMCREPWYRLGHSEGIHDALMWLEARDATAVRDWPRAALWCLARNLRDAAGCHFAWTCGSAYADDSPGLCNWTPWDKTPAPGWER